MSKGGEKLHCSTLNVLKNYTVFPHFVRNTECAFRFSITAEDCTGSRMIKHHSHERIYGRILVRSSHGNATVICMQIGTEIGRLVWHRNAST